MLDFRLSDLHHDARGATAQVLVAPVMLAENAQRLSDGFIKGLGGNLDGMLDALGIDLGDLAGAERHVAQR